jgi:hypothetical protein
MVDRDEFGMTEEESDRWFESSVAVDKEIRSIANLDPERRKLIWKDGSELSFDESVERIHARHPSHSEDLIHAHLCGWLEQGDLPEGLSNDEMERLDSLVSEWAEQIPSRIKMPTD